MTIDIVELVKNEVVDTETKLTNAYALRDKLQAAAIVNGFDLTQVRYGIRVKES